MIVVLSVAVSILGQSQDGRHALALSVDMVNAGRMSR
jgi:hypothetical protein